MGSVVQVHRGTVRETRNFNWFRAGEWGRAVKWETEKSGALLLWERDHCAALAGNYWRRCFLGHKRIIWRIVIERIVTESWAAVITREGNGAALVEVCGICSSRFGSLCFFLTFSGLSFFTAFLRWFWLFLPPVMMSNVVTLRLCRENRHRCDFYNYNWNWQRWKTEMVLAGKVELNWQWWWLCSHFQSCSSCFQSFPSQIQDFDLIFWFIIYVAVN